MIAPSYAPIVKAPRGKGARTKKAARKLRLREEARRTKTLKGGSPFYER